MFHFLDLDLFCIKNADKILHYRYLIIICMQQFDLPGN